jgi:hypothetical protein
MKKYILYLMLFFGFFASVSAQEADKWQIAKSTHFIIYYQNASESFVDRIIEKSEDYYNQIADDLGFRRYNFWLWDERAKIYIHNDAQSYQAATKEPSWSSGCALAKEKIIHSFPNARGFSETILPHELGHIIFREFVGFENSAIPVWLDEGVASHQEKIKYAMVNRRVKAAIEENKFMSIETISGLNPHTIQDNELVSLFYEESVSIIDYLIKEFGKDSFVVFCQALRDKKNLEKAMASVYPFSNINALNLAWKEYLQYE